MIVAAYFLDALSGKACPTADDVMKNLGVLLSSFFHTRSLIDEDNI